MRYHKGLGVGHIYNRLKPNDDILLSNDATTTHPTHHLHIIEEEHLPNEWNPSSDGDGENQSGGLPGLPVTNGLVHLDDTLDGDLGSDGNPEDVDDECLADGSFDDDLPLQYDDIFDDPLDQDYED